LSRPRPERHGRRQEARRKGERDCGQRKALAGAVHDGIVVRADSGGNAEVVPSSVALGPVPTGNAPVVVACATE
jgi:hypothetical protein